MDNNVLYNVIINARGLYHLVRALRCTRSEQEWQKDFPDVYAEMVKLLKVIENETDS